MPEGLARAHLGLLYLQRGRLDKAIGVTEPLGAAADHPAAAAALASRCSALLERDERDAVRRVLPGLVASAERAGHPAASANAHLVASRLHRADGDIAGARAALEAAMAQAERGTPTWLRALVAVHAAEASLADGDEEAAAAHLRSAERHGGRGPTASAIVLARARLRLRRGAPQELATARSELHALAAAEGGAGADGSAGADADPGDGVRIAAWVLLALAEAAAGDAPAARATLARAVRRAEREGFVRTFVDAGSACATLLAGLGHPYAARLLAAFPAEDRAVAEASTGAQPAAALTDRERDVLRALAAGGSYARVADALGLSVNTVRFHVKNAYAKLGVGTRLEAVERARRLGWVDESSGRSPEVRTGRRGP